MHSRFAPPFEAFVAPARQRPLLWRLLAGLCLAALIYALWSAGIVAGYWFLIGSDRSVAFLQSIPKATTPAATFLLLATFIGMGLGPIIAVRLLHRRKGATLFGRAALVLHDFVVAAGLVGIVYGASIAIWLWRFDAVPNLDPKLWLMLLPLSMLGIAVQTGAEGLLFRGYIQQQLAARFRSAIAWLLLPSLLFGFAHYDPITSGDNLWFIVAATALFGLAAGDLTARTGSIGAGWGFHFANNTAAILVLAVKGTIPGLALFTTSYTAGDPVLRGLVVIDIITLAIAWILVRRVLSR